MGFNATVSTKLKEKVFFVFRKSYQCFPPQNREKVIRKNSIKLHTHLFHTVLFLLPK